MSFPARKKSVYSICSFFKYSQCSSSVTRLATAIFKHAHPKNFPSPFNLREFVPACTKSVNSISSFLRSIQISPVTDWTHPILTMPKRKTFDQPWIFLNLFQHAKNEAALSICSGEIVGLKILQSDCLEAFWYISQEKDFPPK